MKQIFDDYYVGLDIGTNSVGWAVTDEKYNIIRFNKKDMWGSRLFEEAKTAKERRIFRGTRRRIDRRRQRINLLEEIFAEEIEKIDPTFFLKLHESNLHREDRTSPFEYTVFNGEYTDVDYHKEYPTIYHLRNAIMNEDRKFDVRLLYLALHHIIKYRGHFIFEGQSFQEITNFDNLYEELINYLNEKFDIGLETTNSAKVKEIICSDYGLNNKAKEFKKIFDDNRILNFFKMSVGSSVSCDNIFDKEEYKEVKVQFSKIEDYDEKRDEFETTLGEDIELIDWAKRIYDYMILEKILEGGNSLSESKVKVFEKHGHDLKELKRLFKKYLSLNDYNDFFRNDNGTNNYVSYIKSSNFRSKNIKANKSVKAEDFYKEIKKYLSKMNAEGEDEKVIKTILNDIENVKYLEKLRKSSNGNIPYQVHEMELKKIIENQKKYHSFLNDDSDKVSNADKIMMLFKFRIPYYVGPLNTDKNVKGENTWVVRKDEKNKSKITPWNFEEKVDIEKSAENFIRRMTNKCTYLHSEDVIPKKSLLYCEYTLLNELNKVKIQGSFINQELKSELVEELFKKEVRVTKKKFIQFLKTKQFQFDENTISGFLVEFNAKLDSYNKFYKIIGEKIETEVGRKFVETCIKFKCLYGDDEKLFNKAINRENIDFISKDELKKISKLKFNEWGRISAKLLEGISFEDKITHEKYESVMDALRRTNHNLMELLSSNFTLAEKIEELNGNTNWEDFNIETYIDELYFSPMTRRSIIQTYNLLMELKSITKKDPAKIFVEMTRGEGVEPRDKRKNQIETLYSGMKDSLNEFSIDLSDLSEKLEKFDDNRLRQKKLFLYFMQLGKSMYTGKEIDLNVLLNSNVYDIDHIYPQSKLKDDSLDNIVLVEKSENGRKSDEIPLNPQIQKNMIKYWIFLKKKGFISSSKFDRLTRTTQFSETELMGFINRQLVVTSQSTKEVINLFKIIFPETEIIYSKAGNVSNFRQKFDLTKVREVNSAHHAQDAYLNIVVGNVYDSKYTKTFWMKREKTSYNLKWTFDYDVFLGKKAVWIVNGEEKSIDIVKRNYNKRTANITKMLIENTGQLFDLTIYKKNIIKDIEIIPNIPKALQDKGIDANKIAEKYGYYKSLKPTYFILFEHSSKGKNVREFERITLIDKAKINAGKDINEILEEKGYSNPKFIRKIKKYQLIEVNGFKYRVSGFINGIEILNDEELYLDDEFIKYAKDVLRFIEENKDNKSDKLKIHFSKRKNNDENEKYEEALKRLDEEFNKLFYHLLDKLKSPHYSKMIISNKFQQIYDKESEFISSDLYTKAKFINGIFQFLGKKSSNPDLTVLIKTGAALGRMNNKKYNALNINGLFIIDESVIGLFTKKEEI